MYDTKGVEVFYVDGIKFHLDEKRICLICGGEYECNKYDKTKTCSNRCGSILSQKTRKGESN